MSFKDSELCIIFRFTVSSALAIKVFPFLSAECFIFVADGNRKDHPDTAHSCTAQQTAPAAGRAVTRQFPYVWVTQERNALGVSGMIYKASYHS